MNDRSLTLDAEREGGQPAGGWRAAMHACPKGLNTAETGIPRLIDANQLVASLLDDSPFAKYLADTKGTVLTWNKQCEALLGYSADEMVGNDSRIIMPDIHRGNVPSSIERIKKNKVVQVESVRRHKDGHLIEVLVTAVAVKADNGDFFGYLIDLRDKRIERAIIAENALLAQMLRASPIPVVGVDIDGTIRTWNAAAERLFGYSQHEALGRHSDLIVPEPLRPEAHRAMAKLCQATTIDVTTTRRANDGRQIPVNMIGTPLMNASGVARGIVLFYRDLTQELLGQQQLRDSEAFSRSVLTASLDWISVVDAEGALIYSNRDDIRAGHRQTSSWLTFWPENQREEIRSKLVESGAQRRGSHVAWRCEGGKKTWYELWVATLPRKAGGEQHFLINARDFTERKATDDHIALIMRELSHRAKNLLSVVGAMARSTTAQSMSLKEFESSFLSRITALATSHDLLVQRDWRGATLQDLVLKHFRPLIGPTTGRIGFIGEDFLLAPAGAQALGMALHELATNAMKYGALSTPNGRIEVTSRKVGERYEVSWRELGGPIVHPPLHQGFGRVVIEEMISETFDCQARIAFYPEGIVWTMSTTPMSRPT